MSKIRGTNELGTNEHGKIRGANELCKEHGKVRGTKVLQRLEIAGTKVPQHLKLQVVARLIRERIH
jgi:hypothetical protein